MDIKVRNFIFTVPLLLWSLSCFGFEQSNYSVEPVVGSDGFYSITIDGSGFGEGPNVVVYDNFNGGSAGDTLNLSSPEIGAWFSSSDYSGDLPKIVANELGKAIEVHNKGAGGTNKIAQIESRFDASSSIFISYSVQVPQGSTFSGATEEDEFSTISSWKYAWITDGSGALAADGNFDLCVPTHTGNGNFSIAGNEGSLGYVGNGDFWTHSGKNFMSFGLFADPVDPVNREGYAFYLHSGVEGAVKVWDRSGSSVMFPAVTSSFDRVKFPGWFGNGDYSNFNAYYDDLYVAIGPRAMKRVVLSDALELIDSVVNVVVPIISWSDTAISIKVPAEYYNSRDEVYLRIYDEDYSSISFLVREKGARSPKPPSAFSAI